MNKLQEIRIAEGMSQSQLAIVSGVSLRMIQNYEQGTKDLLHAQAITVYNLAKALGCTVETLLDP